MNPAELLTKNLRLSIAAKQNFLERADQIEAFARAVDVVVNAYRQGAGGCISPATAVRPPTPSTSPRNWWCGWPRTPAVAGRGAHHRQLDLTAIGNDYGYDAVFARQIEAKLRANDVFLGISTSGKSPNILAALRQCRAQNIPSILFGGRDGGPARALADHCILVSGEDTSTIQELHIVLGHTLCEAVELDIAAR